MKLPIRLIKILSVISTTVFLASAVAAQQVKLPAELKPDSTVSEILTWLDTDGFSKAHIGINAIMSGYDSDELNPDYFASPTSYFIVYSPGFRRLKIKSECELIIRNEQTKFSMKDFSEKTVHPVEIGVNLKRIKFENDRKPFLAKNEKMSAYNLRDVWSVRYKQRGWLNGINSAVILSEEDNRPELVKKIYHGGDGLVFYFNDEKSATDFDNAFSRVIQLCRKL